MVKKKVPRKEGVVKKVPVKTDSTEIEEQTIERVNHTISTIDNFLSKWDATRSKPDSMFPEIVKIRKFYDALSAWQKDALKSKGRKESEDERIRRLRDFVLICRTYS